MLTQALLATLAVSSHAHNERTNEYLYTIGRKRMSPSLAACQDFACVEDILYKEEMDVLDRYIQKIPECHQDINKICLNTYKNQKQIHHDLISQHASNQLHDTVNIDPLHIVSIKNFLQQCSIDPDKIRIGVNDEFLEEKSFNAASVHADRFLPAAIIHPSKHRSKSKPASERVNDHVRAHEAIHVYEGHGSKYSFCEVIASNSSVLTDTEKKEADRMLIDLVYEYEKQADLFPLTRFKESHLRDDLMQNCRYEYRHRNKMVVSKTHPTCLSLLSFIAKIKDLSDQGVQPLYQKPNQGSKTV